MKRLWSKYRDRRFFAGAFTSTPICIVDERAKVEDKQYCRQTLNSRTIRKLVKGFSFVELQVALVILAMGLLSFAGLFRIYSLQTRYIEQSSLPVSTYYIVSQTNRWMRQLGVPADMEETAGQSPWTPPTVNGVEIIGSWVTDTTHAKETGTKRALVFIAHATPGNNATLSTVTYGGRTMTKVIEQDGGSGFNRAYVAAFILNDADITAASNTTFTPTWSDTPPPPASVTYSSVFLQNVDQTTLTGASAGSTVSGTTITTAALANSSGDMVIEAAACDVIGTYTMNNGFTKDIDLSVTGCDGGGGHKSATGIDEIPSVTHATGQQSLIGFVVRLEFPYSVQLDSLLKEFDLSRAVANVRLYSN